MSSSTLLLLAGALLPAATLGFQGNTGIADAGKVVRFPVNATTGGSLFGRNVRRQADVPIRGQQLGTLYTIQVGLGAQNQLVPVQFDTSSGELWVNPVCSQASNPDYCSSLPRFTSSTTLVDLGVQGSSTYLVGYPGTQEATVSWEYVADTVSLGETRVTQQIFGVATSTTLSNVGVLGAGPSPGGYNSPYPLLIDSLVSQGYINSRAFSMDLQGLERGGGSVVYGGIDICRFSGDLVSISIVPRLNSPDGTERFWIVSEGISVTRDDGSSVLVSEISDTFLVDSGSTLTALPSYAFSNLLSVFPSAVARDYGLYSVDCLDPGTGGSVDFTFGDLVIRVPYNDFIWYDPQTGLCMLGAYDANRVDGVPTLGDTFLRAAYVVFDMDNRNIHLAQSANCGSNIVPIAEGPDGIPVTVGGCSVPDPSDPSPNVYATATDVSSTATEEPSFSTAPPASTDVSATEEPTFTTDPPANTDVSATEGFTTGVSTDEPAPTDTSASDVPTAGTSSEGSATETTAVEASSTDAGETSAEPTAIATVSPSQAQTGEVSATEPSSEEPTATSTEDASSSSPSSNTDPTTTASAEPTDVATSEIVTAEPTGALSVSSTVSSEEVTPTTALESDASPSSSASSTSSTASSVPTVPPTSDAMIIAVSPIAGNGGNTTVVRRHAKRQFQVNGGFVGGAGPVNPTDCSLATAFNITAGQLSSGGELVSTNPGVPYQPFLTNATVGAISTTFSRLNGGLTWQNEAFVNSAADFCQDANGQVWVTFDGTAPPFDCAAVQLIPYSATQCVGGVIVSSPPSTVTSPATSVPVSALPSGSVAPIVTSAAALPTITRATITAVSTTTYTITSCAAGKTACRPGQVTTALVTSLATVCPQTTATYTLTRTCVCTNAADGCAVGATVTSLVPLTVRPAPTGGAQIPVPTCPPGGCTANAGAAATASATAAAQAVGATQAAVWSTAVAAAGSQSNATAVTAVNAATATPAVVVAGAGSVVPGLALAVLAGLVAVGL